MSNILLVHGAWGGSWEFVDIIKGLEARGHDASAVDLPGHGDNPAPLSKITMDSYVDTVVERIQSETDPVVLAGHSLGGAVVSHAAERIPERIERLVYVAAMLPQQGQSPIGLMQSDADGKLLPKLVFSEDGTYVTVGVDDIRNVLLNDVQDESEARAHAKKLAIRQAVAPFNAEADVTSAAFGSVPKFYVRCSLDKVLSPALQDRMITSWPVERVFKLESGHFPLMSVPDQLIAAICDASEAPVGTSGRLTG